MKTATKLFVTYLFISFIWVIGFGIAALIFFNYHYLMLSLLGILVDVIIFSAFVIVGGIIYAWKK